MNMKFVAVLLGLATLGMAEECHLTKCPAKFGTCNKCTKFEGKIVPVTREVCSPYSYEKCEAILGGPSGLCDDGCNTCFCGSQGTASTLLFCPPHEYDQEECIDSHGGRTWPHGNAVYACTPCGIAMV